MLCHIWGSRGINQSCFLLMSPSDSVLGAIKYTVQSCNLSNQCAFYKYGPSFLESYLEDGKTLICAENMVYMESKE